ENHHIHGEVIRTQVCVEEVNRENEPDRKQSFLAVDQESNVEPRTGNDLRKEGCEPHRVTRESDDSHAPKDRPVIDFVPVGISFELGLWSEEHEPLDVRDEVLDVLQIRNHRCVAPKEVVLFPGDDAINQIRNVNPERDREHNRAEKMKEQNRSEPADYV